MGTIAECFDQQNKCCVQQENIDTDQIRNRKQKDQDNSDAYDDDLYELQQPTTGPLIKMSLRPIESIGTKTKKAIQSHKDITDEETISVTTWDILATSSIASKGIGYCDSKYLSWEQHRKNLLFHILLDELCDSDIISFQSVDCFDELSDYYSQRNYEFVSEQSSCMQSGLSIAFCRDKFDILYPYHRLEFDGLSKVNQDNAYFLTHDIAIIIILFHKFTKKRILIANTKCDESMGHELRRSLQLNALCNAVSSLSTDDDIIFINGNLNCDPLSQSYSYLINGWNKQKIGLSGENYKNEQSKLTKKHEKHTHHREFSWSSTSSNGNDNSNNCVVLQDNNKIPKLFHEIDLEKDNLKDLSIILKHKLKLRSVHECLYGCEPRQTTNTPYADDCRDYIFVNQSQNFIDHMLIGKKGKQLIPNKNYPSDHYYLTASVQVKKKDGLALLDEAQSLRDLL